MKTVHIVGGKNHGKTTLMSELIQEMARRGLRVGTIKHTNHDREVDTPKTDSYRLRSAGASPSAVVAGNLMAVYMPLTGDDDGYQLLAGLYEDCDLVLVEGDLARPGIKIEVWREAAGGPCLALLHRDISAVVTDDLTIAGVPVWPRGNVARIADHILSLVATVEYLKPCHPPGSTRRTRPHRRFAGGA